MRRLAALATAVVLAACPDRSAPDAGAPDAGPIELAEKEPNDRPEQALTLSRASMVSASLSADPSKADEDWYLLDVASPQVADITVSGIPGGDVGVEVYDTDRNRLVAVNSEGQGKPERLPNLGVKGKLLIKVYPARKGSGGAYTLTCLFTEVPPGFEAEPNDRAVDANTLPLGETISGYLGHAADEDWYRFELAPPGSAGEAPPSAPATEALDGAVPGATEGAGAPVGEAVDAGASAPPAADPASLALKITVAGVEGARLDVQVLSAAEAPLFQIKGKDGEGLSLRNIGVRASDRMVYVVVRSAWTGSGKDARRGYNAEKAYTLSVAQEEAGSTAELEPNDEMLKATPLPRDGFREGFLSPKTDVDYYVLRADPPALVRVQLSGVERLDLVLSVVKPGEGDNAPEQVALKANDGAVKEPEYLNNLLCAGVCWLKVEGGSRKVDNKWVRDFENPDQPYRLTVTSVADPSGEEREPNNTPNDATPMALGRPIRGTVYPKKDVDLFSLDLTGRPVRTPLKATLLGILKVDVGLYLHRVGDDGKMTLVQTADRAKGDAPEVIRFSAEPGEYVFEVRDAKGREANFQDSYQLTVEESE
jgi:hypothetical protein